MAVGLSMPTDPPTRIPPIPRDRPWPNPDGADLPADDLWRVIVGRPEGGSR